MARQKFSRTLTITNVKYVTVTVDEEGNLVKSEVVSIKKFGDVDKNKLGGDIAKEIGQPIVIIECLTTTSVYEMDILEFIELAKIREPKQEEQIQE